MNIKGKAEGADLHKIAEGMMYFSETEYPLLPFEVTATDESELPSFIASSKNARDQFVKYIPAENFFARFEKYLEYNGPDELMKENARQFLKLRDHLEEYFCKTLTYRIENPGEAVIPVFIIAKNKEGFFTGLETTAVET